MHGLILSRLPNTPVCMRPLHSAPGLLARTPPHRAQNPAPTPGSPLSRPAAAVRLSGSVCASSAAGSAQPRDTPDAAVCDLPALPSGAVTLAIADSRSAASPALTPPALCAAVHPTGKCGTECVKADENEKALRT